MEVITINQLIGILCVVVSILGLVGYISTKAMVAKYLKSIDNSEGKHIKADQKFIEIEKDIASAFRGIKNNQSDISELDKEFKLYTNSIKVLTETISSFEKNSKEQHVEIKNLVNETNKVNSALLSYLKVRS